VLGASERPSVGRTIVENLERIGFPGEIYPINPRYENLLGRRCYRSVEDLPDGVDVLAFCVNHERVLEGLRAAAKKGVRAGVAFDAGFAESDETGRQRQAELVAVCREAGIAFCGPNCMGVISPHERSLVYLNALRDPAPLPGNVGLISQSGSIVIGLLADCRRFGFSRVVSTGNEAVIVAADVLEYLVEDPATRVIAMFLETVRQPERFVAVLDRAAARGKPVVVLKVGKSERARRAITSHTGGLAGESRVVEAVLRAHRAIEVHDMDELTETLAACQGARRPAGRRIAVVTNSGGHTELILDVAANLGIELPALSPATRAEAARVIGSVAGDGNPLDSWGNGDFQTNVPHALRTLGADPDIDAVVWCTDSMDGSPLGTPERFMTYASMLLEGAKGSAKPFYLMGTRPGIFRRDQHELLSAQGIAMIGGTRQGLRAIDRLARWAAPPAAPRPIPARAIPTLAAMLPGAAARRTIHEHDAKRLLASAGLPVVKETLCATREAAIAAAAGNRLSRRPQAGVRRRAASLGSGSGGRGPSRRAGRRRGVGPHGGDPRREARERRHRRLRDPADGERRRRGSRRRQPRPRLRPPPRLRAGRGRRGGAGQRDAPAPAPARGRRGGHGGRGARRGHHARGLPRPAARRHREPLSLPRSARRLRLDGPGRGRRAGSEPHQGAAARPGLRRRRRAHRAAGPALRRP
jgi:acyl-CoA synthetase (NDP forming)